VFAQALVAARRTVEGPREAHSVHGYFILPGDLAAPIVYFVDRLRDGNSFTTRRVTAIQHGQAIFNLSASFHVQEDGRDHQSTMPEAPPPEDLAPELQLIREMADRIPEPLRHVLTQDRPIDFRPVSPIDPFNRCAEPVGTSGSGHRPFPTTCCSGARICLDYGLLPTALQPHGLSHRSRGLQMASLDHAVWLHRPFRADDWLLYAMDSPVASGSRGFVRGSIFARTGELVASVAQEGLIRLREPRS
jgi:acyl-CoA thioesterase-2